MNRNKTKILALSPHPDDIEMGAGGTLLKFMAEGAEVDIVYGLRESKFTSRRKTVADNEEKYGYNYSFFSSYVGTRPEFNPAAVKKLDKLLAKTPYTHLLINSPDAHQDHKVFHKLAMTAGRLFKGNIWQYEVPLYKTSFDPNLWVSIDGYVERKKDWLLEFEELSIKQVLGVQGLNKYRGLQLPVENMNAEAFKVIQCMI